MALRTVSGKGTTQSTYVYTSKMNVGDKTEGFYVGTKAGKFGDIIVLQTEAGTNLDVLASGSLKYLQKNAQEDPSQKLVAGQYTVITKTAAYKGKDGKDRNKFSVQQDDAKTIQVTDAMTTAATTTVETTANATAERLAKARKVS